MLVTVSLRDLTFFGHHGADLGEQDRPQPFRIDASFDVETNATETDALEDCVNYARVRQVIREYIENERRSLMERMAFELSEKLYASFPLIRSLDLEITKLMTSTFDGNGMPSVRIRRERE